MIVIDQATRDDVGRDIIRSRAELDAIQMDHERGLEEMARAINAMDQVRARLSRHMTSVGMVRDASDRWIRRLADAELSEGAPC